MKCHFFILPLHKTNDKKEYEAFNFNSLSIGIVCNTM